MLFYLEFEMDVSEITRFKPGSLQQGAAPTEGINVHYLGIFLENDFWTPPPPINFVHGSDRKFLNLT